MHTHQIRTLAICIFGRGDRVLVNEAFDPVKGLTFCRPLGGGIEFGETGAQAVAREAREEIGAEVAHLRYLVGYVGYVRLSHPGSTVRSSIYKIVFARDALRENHGFACQPAKSSCARMTSCAEALFHLERCGATGIDGDRDGIPCEQQWCN